MVEKLAKLGHRENADYTLYKDFHKKVFDLTLKKLCARSMKTLFPEVLYDLFEPNER